MSPIEIQIIKGYPTISFISFAYLYNLVISYDILGDEPPDAVYVARCDPG
jgi:hypothetical protein